MGLSGNERAELEGIAVALTVTEKVPAGERNANAALATELLVKPEAAATALTVAAELRERGAE